MVVALQNCILSRHQHNTGQNNLISHRKGSRAPGFGKPSLLEAQPTEGCARCRVRVWCVCVVVVVVGFLVIGVRRIPELWATVPEERADYWPARKGKDEEVEEEEVEGPGRNIPGAEG